MIVSVGVQGTLPGELLAASKVGLETGAGAAVRFERLPPSTSARTMAVWRQPTKEVS